MPSSVHLVIFGFWSSSESSLSPPVVSLSLSQCWCGIAGLETPNNLGCPALEGREGSTSGLQLCTMGGSTGQCSHWCQWHSLQVLDAFPDPRQILCCADASLKEAYGWLSASWENPSKAQRSHLRSDCSRSLGVSWSLKSLLCSIHCLQPLLLVWCRAASENSLKLNRFDSSWDLFWTALYSRTHPCSL